MASETIGSNQFKPNYLTKIHPGIHLEEELLAAGMKQTELAARTGITTKTINSIIKGNAPISPETAISLESVLGKPTMYWLKLEAIFQAGKAEELQGKSLEDDQILLKDLDIKKMVSEGWIQKHSDNILQLKEVLSFFGVANLKQIFQVWNKLEVNYRTSQAYRKNHSNIMAWLRKGEIDSKKIKCKTFSSQKFKKALIECRKITSEPFEYVGPKIQELCAEAGVAVVYVPALSNIATSGAAQWLDKDKALIQLSLRGKRDDKFWFDFFHEAGHILLHGRKEKFIDSANGSYGTSSISYETMETKAQEGEADIFSSDFLINKKDFSKFVARKDFTKESVIDFSKKKNISPGIVVGQLQKREYIGWKDLNELKQKYDFS